MAQTLIQEEEGYNIIVQDGYLVAEAQEPCPRCFVRYSSLCDCMGMKKRLKLFNEANLPAVFRAATLKALIGDNTTAVSLNRAYKWITGWARKEPVPSRGLLLSGTNGIGKSFAMVALLRSLTLERGIPCRFVDFKQLLIDLKACYNGYGSEYKLLQDLKTLSVLVIDDLGACRDTDWAKDVLQTLIALRYNTTGTTFITTTLAIEANSTPNNSLEKWATPHCSSRLVEMCYWMPVSGPDRRRSPLLRNSPFGQGNNS